VRLLALIAALLSPQACPGAAGEVAYARGGALHVVSLATCRDRVLVPRGVRSPVRFSADGRSIRYGDAWVVARAGGRPRRVARETGPAVRSPNGRLVARVRASRAPGAATGRQTIWVEDVRSGRGNVAHTVRESYRGAPAGNPGPLALVGWSADSAWILFTIYPFGSSSIASDGLLLRAVPAGGGPPAPIASMLLYRDYLTWCGRRLVLVAGGSRLATENKRLLVTEPPRWRARPIVRDPARAWASPTCAPDGRRLAVLSQPVGHDYAFASARWQLWLATVDGRRRRLTLPAPGRSDESPRWLPDGSILFVRRTRDFRGRLMLWRAGRVSGPIADLGRDLGYYGHHDWWWAADWHR
jgi:hypothetical protein